MYSLGLVIINTTFLVRTTTKIHLNRANKLWAADFNKIWGPQQPVKQPAHPCVSFFPVLTLAEFASQQFSQVVAAHLALLHRVQEVYGAAPVISLLFVEGAGFFFQGHCLYPLLIKISQFIPFGIKFSPTNFPSTSNLQRLQSSYFKNMSILKKFHW